MFNISNSSELDVVALTLHTNVNQWKFGRRFCVNRCVTTPLEWMACTCPLLCGPTALVIQRVWHRFYRLTVAAGRRHKPPKHQWMLWLSTALQKKHITPLSLLSSDASSASLRGSLLGNMHTHTESPPPPSNHRWLLLRSVCKKREQITVTRRSNWVETTVEAQYTEQCLGRI